MKRIVYAGQHYGQPHHVISESGRMLRVCHDQGEPFEVHVIDTEDPASTLLGNDRATGAQAELLKSLQVARSEERARRDSNPQPSDPKSQEPPL